MKNLLNIAVITVLAGVLLTGCNSKESDYKVELLNYIESSNNNNIDLNTAVSKALIDHQSLILNGEVLTEGHVILDKEETNDYIKVYLIASGGNFGFEGDNFTIISGYSLVPMVIEFSNDSTLYRLVKNEEDIINVNTFGKSGTPEELLQEFELDIASIIIKIKNNL